MHTQEGRGLEDINMWANITLIIGCSNKEESEVMVAVVEMAAAKDLIVGSGGGIHNS